jgi:hypothetical protein
MKTDGSNYALMTSSVSQTLEMRDEATLQGIDNSKVVWDTVSAYGSNIVPANPNSFEGTYQALGFLPFEEAKNNKTLAAFLSYVKQVGGTPDQFSVYSWAATLAFAQAARDAVAKNGINGLTRSSLVASLRSLRDFDAGGMMGKKSFDTSLGSPCFMVVRYLGGKWVRQYPTKVGTFDCKPANTGSVTADLSDSS